MSQACAEWRGELGAYLMGALDGEERAAMRRHLQACAACRAEYAELLPVRDWLGRLAAAAEPPAARLGVRPAQCPGNPGRPCRQ